MIDDIPLEADRLLWVAPPSIWMQVSIRYFPFGYGLSYTTFVYNKLTLSATDLKADGTLTASVDVTNIGKRAGTEVVQLYVRDKVGSVTRPVKS